jgi:molybdopterin synthase catalytic subunit
MAEEKKAMFLDEEDIHVELTYDHLDISSIMKRVKRPKAGAIVLFAGTTTIPIQFQCA